VEYLLDVPRGDYELTVAAKDHVPHRSRISVGTERTRTIVITLNRKGEPEQGNAVGRAHAWLSDIRTYPAKRVPDDARQIAIYKKRHPPPPGPPLRALAALAYQRDPRRDGTLTIATGLGAPNSYRRLSASLKNAATRYMAFRSARSAAVFPCGSLIVGSAPCSSSSLATSIALVSSSGGRYMRSVSPS
jgi:hypothetical protein